MATFDEVLDALEKLPREDQDELFSILMRRRRAQPRAELARNIAEARREFETGQCRQLSVKEIMAEITQASRSFTQE